MENRKEILNKFSREIYWDFKGILDEWVLKGFWRNSEKKNLKKELDEVRDLTKSPIFFHVCK